MPLLFGVKDRDALTRDLDGMIHCCVCLDTETMYARITRCHHASACIACSPHLHACPLCRAPLLDEVYERRVRVRKLRRVAQRDLARLERLAFSEAKEPDGVAEDMAAAALEPTRPSRGMRVLRYCMGLQPNGVVA